VVGLLSDHSKVYVYIKPSAIFRMVLNVRRVGTWVRSPASVRLQFALRECHLSQLLLAGSESTMALLEQDPP
jgi:hypothetical protein